MPIDLAAEPQKLPQWILSCGNSTASYGSLSTVRAKDAWMPCNVVRCHNYVTNLTVTCIHLMGGSYLAEQAKRYQPGLSSPEDVAALAVFLPSDKICWFSGQNYVMGESCFRHQRG